MSFWPSLPNSVAQRSSDGVANYVSSDQVGSGSIGYVEAGYALYRRFPVAGDMDDAPRTSHRCINDSVGIWLRTAGVGRADEGKDVRH